MPKVFLGIGSNIEPDKNLGSALDSLEKRFGALIRSSIYESAAVGFEGDLFFNMVVAFDSELPVQEIVKALREIEIKHGRSKTCEKFSARTLDLDLILYGAQVLEKGKIKLPRDDILRYAFVLEPLAEIAPDLKHPVQKRTYAELWHDFDKIGVKQKRR